MPFATSDDNTTLHAAPAAQPSSVKGYYANTRPDVQSMIPPSARRILDIGCGEGSMAEEVKNNLGAEVWGIEYMPQAADKARLKLDKVLCGDVAALLPQLPAAYFDVIICADVLEHLIDPWQVLNSLREKLAPGGAVVASIPNVRFWSVVKNLLEGHWNYTEFGILDRTHLRFFTFESVVALFTAAGFTPTDIQANVTDRANGIPDSIVQALVAAGLQVGDLSEQSCHFQYLIVAHATTIAKPREEPVTTCVKKLNLGCGSKIIDGYLNVDRSAPADLVHDLESFPWPWPDNSIEEIRLVHVLEHLGKDTATFKNLVQEIYRVACNNAKIQIIVPHPRHDSYLADPTHVRPITEETIRLLSRRVNLENRKNGQANSCLALEWNVDFELENVIYHFDQRWQSRLQQGLITADELFEAALDRSNVIEMIEMSIHVIKH